MKIRLSKQIYPVEIIRALKVDFEGKCTIKVIDGPLDSYWIEFQPGKAAVSEFLNKLLEKTVIERFG
jgi:hypothetical protein